MSRFLFPIVRTLVVLLVCSHAIACAAGKPPLSRFSLPENEPVGFRIGSLRSLDGGSGAGKFELPADNPDNAFFRLEGGELISAKSFDFERRERYEVTVWSVESTEEAASEFTIEVFIRDVVGKWDENGIADAELAAKYAQVREGDYLIFNATEGVLERAFDVPLQFPNKIMIKGDTYARISLDLANVAGNSVDERLVISNFLGQVQARVIALKNGDFWRFTGRYEPRSGAGDAAFRGCDTDLSTVDFGGSSGRYGFWVRNEWRDETTSLVYVAGTANGYEIDHLELADGGFAGIMCKQDGGSENMDDVYIHHFYVHDIGSEGIYLGSTQPDPQHQFNRLRIENCLFLRTGAEAIQVGQLGRDCIVRNNVLWGAFDWMSPFARYQDKVLQVGLCEGDITVSHNIVMGGADSFLYAVNVAKDQVPSDSEPIVIARNLFWGSRGGAGGFIQSYPGTTKPWRIEENYWGYFDYSYDRVYRQEERGEILLSKVEKVPVELVRNTFDVREKVFFEGESNANVSEVETSVESIPPPAFVDLIGESDHFSYLLWTRWSARVGEEDRFPASQTRKGDRIVYRPGEVVQHHHDGKTLFYRCEKEHSDHEPLKEGDAVWTLLTWEVDQKISHTPPDDARLRSDTAPQFAEFGLKNEPAAVVRSPR